MSNEHDDDEIRESIPCVAFSIHEDRCAITVCLPLGYSLDAHGGVWRRGVNLCGHGGERAAWDHAIAREKARRAREGHTTPADKAAAMLAEVIRERDELRAKVEQVRGLQRWGLVAAANNAFAWAKAEMTGPWVKHDDIAAILGKDGEA